MQKNLTFLCLLLIFVISCKKEIETEKSIIETVFAPVDTVLVNILTLDPEFIIDVHYATENNFTGEILYPTNNVFLRKIVAESLVEAHKEAQELGYRFKIFDGYRPVSVQWKMWEIMPDERYVADPRTGSRHNRGAAIDLTLTDLDGNEINMGTEFDDFTEVASPDYKDLPDEIKQNRNLLINLMKKHGFTVYPTEWWHFDYENWEHFNMIDFDIE